MRAAIQILARQHLMNMDVRDHEWQSGPIWAPFPSPNVRSAERSRAKGAENLGFLSRCPGGAHHDADSTIWVDPRHYGVNRPLEGTE
jgi:hypothetical protein